MKMICQSCKGEGTINVSTCCGASPRSNGDCDTSDFGICSECGDHCDYGVECEECGGAGEVEVNIPKSLESVLNILKNIPDSGYEYITYRP